MAQDVPHPGPQPELFRFPERQALIALEQIEALRDRLAATGSSHGAAADDARVDFTGDATASTSAVSG